MARRAQLRTGCGAAFAQHGHGEEREEQQESEERLKSLKVLGMHRRPHARVAISLKIGKSRLRGLGHPPVDLEVTRCAHS